MGTFQEASQDMDVEALARNRKRYVTMMVVVGIFGGGLYGYTLTFLSGALVTMNFGGSNNQLSAWNQSIITAVMLLGCAVGSFCGGNLADRLGRKRLILYGALLALVGALMCALATNIAFFAFSRMIVGFAVGTTSCVIPIYLGEMAPSAQRGRLVSVNSVMINISQLLASLVNAVLAVKADWHAMVWAAVVPAVLLVITAIFVHETPSFLARHGMETEAVKLLLETRPKSEAEETFTSFQAAEKNETKGTKENFSTPWLRRVLIAGVGAALINQLVGSNAINFFAPTMFSSTLGIDPDNSIIAMVPVMIVSSVAAVIGGLGFIDKINRRTALMVGLGGVSVFLGLVGVCYLFIDPNHPSTSMSWLLIGLVMFDLAFAQGMVSPVTWLLIAEVFPAKVRGKGVGYANVAMNAANFIISLLFLPLLNAVGGAVTFFIFALINVGAVFFTKAFIPETRGKSLEQIEQEARARTAKAEA